MMIRSGGRSRRTVRFPTRGRLALYAVAGGVWLTGGLWLLFHYFIHGQGEFGTTSHPLESWWLTLHGAFAFLSIWTFGVMWATHVVPGWATRRRRPTGIAMTTTVGWLMVSGYLLYYLGGEQSRFVAGLLHWSVGLGAPILFVVHGLRARSIRRARLLAERRLTSTGT
jgi:hypothetical protein